MTDSLVVNTSKSFLGGISGALGFIITIVLVLCACCTSILLFGPAIYNKLLEEVNKKSSTDNTLVTPTTTPVAIKVYKKGEQAQSGPLAIVVNSTADNVTSDNQFIKPRSGYKYYGIEVTVINENRDSQYLVNQLDFKLKDANDYVYSTSFMTIKEPDLAMQKLAKGEKLRGWILYEVPKDVKILKLIYNSTYDKNNDAIVEL